jgi:hypothetical protein
LGIEAKYDYTPAVYRRLVFAATQAHSFADASEALSELGELRLSAKRLWRATKRVGDERVAECRQAAESYDELPLPAQRQSPVAQVPEVACVQMDGGRFQRRERVVSSEPPAEQPAPEPAESDAESSEASPWSEYKAGVLLSMTSQTHEADPCPELPTTFRDPGKMRERAREIKGVTHESAVSHQAAEKTEQAASDDVWRPRTSVKSVVASGGDVDVFGPLLASAAYARGFHAAPRKAFVADGSSANWGVWRKYFSHYTPILDFVHALMYVYAAAMAGRGVDEGWSCYARWAQWLWSGWIDPLLEALAERQGELGVPDKKERDTPRAQLAASLAYLTNQRGRMNYAQYRQQGLPLTSSPIESTIKQINRRIKGTEKFWDDGTEPMLHLVADRLSQTGATADFWSRRLDRLLAVAPHSQAA